MPSITGNGRSHTVPALQSYSTAFAWVNGILPTCASIPLKFAVARVIGYITGKSAISCRCAWVSVKPAGNLLRFKIKNLSGSTSDSRKRNRPGRSGSTCCKRRSLLQWAHEQAPLRGSQGYEPGFAGGHSTARKIRRQLGQGISRQSTSSLTYQAVLLPSPTIILSWLLHPGGRFELLIQSSRFIRGTPKNTMV